LMDDWYSPGEIRFNREQMMWLIRYLEMLKKGNWPPNPQGSGYIDAPLSRKTGRKGAYFETPCQFAAEVEMRLKRTGADGDMLCEQIKGEIETYGDLVVRDNTNPKQALNYISLWDFRKRKTPYSLWKAKKKSYKNIRIGGSA